MTPSIFSVVIPVYHEQDSIPRLHTALAEVADRTPGQWEFVFVDDGSRDGTWEALLAIRAQDPRVRAIRLKRNFGQTAAMACGIEAARGDIIVTMDGDLQNDPADIPNLLAKLDEGYDVVCGWRHQRQDKLWTRKVPSMVANRLIGWLTGVRLHDYGCSLKAYRAETIKRTPLYAQFHRFIPALSTLTGALIAEIKVQHHPRRYGKTKYTISRTWRVALDMLTVSVLVKFVSRPLRLFGVLALGFSGVAAVCIVRSWEWYVGPYHTIPQVLPGVAVLSAWLAGHLLVVGLLAELCLSTAHARSTDLVAATER
ncbi:MAG: glycosyltransferase family 2 protein [Candidatus Omnitrophica bacterium]|nr:glycosyltransferase family 2 protein [Candidatus Omnitrophota bacterium]